MTYLPNTMGIRTAIYGTKVERPMAALPSSALGNVFTVSGGRIAITGLVGEVTTVLGAGVNTITLGYAPTVGTGSATALGTSATITTAAAGSHIAANPGGATLIDVSTQAGVLLPSIGFLVDVGSVTITTSATVTGSVKWTLTYVPMDDTALVAAA